MFLNRIKKEDTWVETWQHSKCFFNENLIVNLLILDSHPNTFLEMRTRSLLI